MRIEKRKICDLPMVYVTAELNLGGKRYLAAASEAPGEHAYIIDPETGNYADLWQGETGVMNIIQIPGEDRLLVITKFYPVFQSKEASVCLLTPGADGYMAPWKIEEVLKLPFVHRIGIFKSKYGTFLLGCQLCHDKDFQEDWTQPGSLWTAPIPHGVNETWQWSLLYEGLTKNHGLYIDQLSQVYICSENGVMHFDMSSYQAGQKQSPVLISTTPTSDICLMHGKDTLAGTIEPFHGDKLAVYRYRNDCSEYRTGFEITFGHVVWIGEIFGREAVIAGSRGGEEKQLEIIFLDDEKRISLEKNVGPTQITVYQDGEAVKVLSANHGSGEVTLYTLLRD